MEGIFFYNIDVKFNFVFMLLFFSIDFYPFSKTNRLANSLNSDVVPDLGPNCLQGLLALKAPRKNSSEK